MRADCHVCTPEGTLALLGTPFVKTVGRHLSPLLILLGHLVRMLFATPSQEARRWAEAGGGGWGRVTHLSSGVESQWVGWFLPPAPEN